MSEHRPVVSAARVIAACTLLSRVTGMVRDILLARVFGMSWINDAFNFAFQIPNLFRRLFGEGALSAVFVPVFTRSLEKEGRPAAWEFLARTLSLLVVALIAVIVAIEIGIVLIWSLGSPSDPQQAEARRLLLSLTALMLPFMLTICVVALFSSILNCLGSFVPGALAPMIMNLMNIGGILLLAPLLSRTDPAMKIYGVAISVVLAGIIQVLVVTPVLLRNGVHLRWDWNPRDARVREILRTMAPVTIGQGLLVFGVFLDAQICTLLTHVHDAPEIGSFLGLRFRYPLDEGALTAISFAQRLYQFPLGVLATSVAVAALPVFSRLAAHGEWARWREEVRSAFRLSMFAGLLAGAMMIPLAVPIVRLLFEHGRFTSEDTHRTAYVLAWYGAGMWAFCTQHIVLRAFYSFGDVRTPLWISCVLMPANVLLSFVLLWFDGIREAAFGISTSLTSAITVAAGLWLLRRRAGRGILNRASLFAVMKMALSAALAVLIVMAVRNAWTIPLAHLQVPEVVRRLADTLGALGIGCVLYLVLAWLLGLSESQALLRRHRSKPSAAPPSPTPVTPDSA